MPRRKPFTRPLKSPDNIQLTKRDIRILEGIYTHGGMLSLRQIDRLFFTGRGSAHPRQRMSKLFVNRYVAMPSPKELHQVPYGETVYWLDERGAEIVAGLYGETPKTFDYRRDIRWSLVAHDLRVNDVHIAVTQACERDERLELQHWEGESVFRAWPDIVTYTNERGRQQRRRIIPDSFFHITRDGRDYAFLLELDMATEHNPRVGRTKILPGLAYLGSEAYRERFRLQYGRWLFVTTGERRMHNMRAQARRMGARGEFYFTTFEQLTPETVLREPIWLMPDRDVPISLIP